MPFVQSKLFIAIGELVSVSPEGLSAYGKYTHGDPV